jgi:hypothetical protein
MHSQNNTKVCLLFKVQVKETTYLLNMLNIVGMIMTTMLQSLRIPNKDRYVK